MASLLATHAFAVPPISSGEDSSNYLAEAIARDSGQPASNFAGYAANLAETLSSLDSEQQERVFQTYDFDLKETVPVEGDGSSAAQEEGGSETVEQLMGLTTDVGSFLNSTVEPAVEWDTTPLETPSNVVIPPIAEGASSPVLIPRPETPTSSGGSAVASGEDTMGSDAAGESDQGDGTVVGNGQESGNSGDGEDDAPKNRGSLISQLAKTVKDAEDFVEQVHDVVNADRNRIEEERERIRQERERIAREREREQEANRREQQRRNELQRQRDAANRNQGR